VRERVEKGDTMLRKKVLPPGWKFRGCCPGGSDTSIHEVSEMSLILQFIRVMLPSGCLLNISSGGSFHGI